METSYRIVQRNFCGTYCYGIAVELDNFDKFQDYKIGQVLINQFDKEVSLRNIMTLFRFYNANVFVHCRYSEADMEHGR